MTSINPEHVRAVTAAWTARHCDVTTGERSSCADYMFRSAPDCRVAEDESGFIIGKLRTEPPGGGAESQPSRTVTRLMRCRELLEREDLSAARRLDGSYALIAWSERSRELTVVRDPIGICPLYYRHQGGDLIVADRLDTFGAPWSFDPAYIASFIAGRGRPNTALTISTGVRALEPGTWMRWKDGRLTRGEFWSPEVFRPLNISNEDAAREFRRLLAASLSVHVDPGGTTWSHLSGGVDSSSIVCFAEQVGREHPEKRIGGTLTFHHPLGDGNDQKYVRKVLSQYPTKNITVGDYWPWCADEAGPPDTDRPSRDYPLYARDRQAAAKLQAAGGTSLLSGIGPDYYLPDTSKHCSDLLWSFRGGDCIRELRAWTIARRGSFWRVALTDVVFPLVYSRVPGWGEPALSAVASWFQPRFRRMHNIRGLVVSRNGIRDAKRGGHYAHQVGCMLRASAEGLSVWRYAPSLEMRHPFLHKPLVEFCLQLPLRLRTDVHWPKPILRSAMKGILPEELRHRAGGSLLAPVIQWAFRRERNQLHDLLRNSILADLGCIEPRNVQRALCSFEVYRSGASSFLYALLALETWLSAKAGRWSMGTWR